ncbi:MAG: Zn-dependent hydrolase of the beta-lactamase fold-like protein [Candidatus Solibacter sp.]|nr:Zn-dependent hydrolase of the beta-lactamase fold-like protein [Candidatus Solibacter sp.]
MTRAAVSLFLLSATLYAQSPNLSISWVGQSSFVLRSDAGPTVVTDPPAPSIGYTLPSLNADAVTITHNHTDHNNSAGVGGKFTLIDGRPTTTRQEVTAAGLQFVLIPGYHDNQNGSLRGPNTIVRWNQSGLKIAHFGDLGQDQLTPAQLADLQNLDVIFLPAGGFFTITPERAAAYVNELKPRVAILMHYRTPLGGAAQTAGLPEAAASFSPVLYKPSTVVVSANTLPSSTEVWVMEPAADAVAVNAATFTAGMPVAPGSIASLFGKFSGSATTSAGAFPLPRKLAETEVLVAGKAAPLYYVSSGQLNFQVPAAQTPGQVLAEVRVGGQVIARAPVTVIPYAPGIFAVANQDGRANSANNPAHPGEVLHIYATGQGAVNPAVDDGVAAPAQPLSTSTSNPNVFFTGRQLAISYSGLAPGFAGVWQLDVALPSDVPTGPDLPLTVQQGIAGHSTAVTVVR